MKGYRITEYCDVMFDELIVGMDFTKSIAASFDKLAAALIGSEADVMSNKFGQVKASLRDRIKMKAAGIGANALIGIHFEASCDGLLMV